MCCAHSGRRLPFLSLRETRLRCGLRGRPWGVVCTRVACRVFARDAPWPASFQWRRTLSRVWDVVLRVSKRDGERQREACESGSGCGRGRGQSAAEIYISRERALERAPPGRHEAQRITQRSGCKREHLLPSRHRIASVLAAQPDGRTAGLAARRAQPAVGQAARTTITPTHPFMYTWMNATSTCLKLFSP